jgi:hypothetical protein
MTTIQKLGLCLISSLQLSAFAQNNLLYGLMGVPGPGTNVAAGTTHLGTLDVNTGTFTQISPNSLASVTSATGAALDPVSQTYYFQTQTAFVATSMQTGLPTAQNPITNPIQQTYFDNYRYNTSDSTIYGIARHTVSGGGLGQATTDLYLASINPATGVVTQISPQSIGNMYALQGCAINPHEMVYYYSNQGKIIGLDLYTGLVYSNPTITYPEGGMFFDNYTYNCADTTIYGIIRTNAQFPNVFYLGKVDPQTGIATRVSQSPLPYTTYSINGSSTIDPINGVYYCMAKLPTGPNVIIGVSVTTGLVVFEQQITAPGAPINSLLFNLLRHPGDCFQAAAFRPNPLSGGGSSVGLSENTANSIQVAPNPFDTELEITANASIQSLILRDAQGKLVLRQEATSNTVTIETATLQNGIYFLEVQTANGLELVKVVK